MREVPICRREFLERISQSAVAACVAVGAVTGIRADEKGGAGELVLGLADEKNAALKSVGGAVYAERKGAEEPLIVWRQSESVVRAFSSKCTHRGCKVGLPRDGVLECPCHGARFDSSGQPTKRPAKKPLGELPADIRQDEVVVYLSGKRPEAPAQVAPAQKEQPEMEKAAE